MKNICSLVFLLAFISFSFGQVNFTASKGKVEKEIIFYIDESSLILKPETIYLWNFGDGESSTEKQPIHNYKKAGTYKVCLQINDEKQVCKKDVFTVTQNGLKVKYVEDIIWPSGDMTKVDSPFSYRIKADGVTYDFHRALDIVGEVGDDIKAIADGIVYKSFKHILVIKHKMDTPMYFQGKVTDVYYSMSLHLDERYVNKGDIVKKGDIVAAVGNINSKGYPHNHFEIRVGSYYSRGYLEKNRNKANKKININNRTGNFIDPHVNPLLFLDNIANEKNSLKYSILKGKNSLFVKVSAKNLEDYFNEIEIVFGSGSDKKGTIKLNFNSREGLPYLSKRIVGDKSNRGNNYDFDYQNPNDQFDIHPIKFKHRNEKNYQITFSFKDIDFKSKNGDFILVKDIYGNIAKQVKWMN